MVAVVNTYLLRGERRVVILSPPKAGEGFLSEKGLTTNGAKITKGKRKNEVKMYFLNLTILYLVRVIRVIRGSF